MLIMMQNTQEAHPRGQTLNQDQMQKCSAILASLEVLSDRSKMIKELKPWIVAACNEMVIARKIVAHMHQVPRLISLEYEMMCLFLFAAHC